MNRRELEDEFDKDAPLREPLDKLGATPPPQSHQDFILSAARGTAHSIRQRNSQRPRWQWPVALAASFVVGVIGTLAYTSQRAPGGASLSGLTIPATPELRGEANQPTIPVEQAPPDVWYRYIRELVYSGDVALASKHLQRFVQLHPDYVPEQ